jgi:arabinan endo-1,5-alpha-L-arabinosidase
MKHALLAIVLTAASAAFALDGQFGIHDPSTVVLCDGKYYTWGTGGTPLVSDDGWTWRAGERPPVTGAAPDVIHIGDRYYMYIANPRLPAPETAPALAPGGDNAAHAFVYMIWSKTLDPKSPDYKWNMGGVVATSNGVEDSNAIDPGAFLDPTDGKLWMVDGSYIGYIRLVQLDPKTGLRFVKKTTDPKTGKTVTTTPGPIDLAINCEASDMIYHDGWYYLLATHGSCCAGSSSNYNIRMGRSRKVTGPYLDAEGVDMMLGGGTKLIGSGNRYVGAGHFGLMDLGQGVMKFSMHWEADFDRGGASVLDIRPLLWKDGWPVAGENIKEGTYEIESLRTGTALELAVEGVPVGGPRGGRGGGRGAGAPGGPGRGDAAGQGAAPGRGAAPGAAPAAPGAALGAAAGRGGAGVPGGGGGGRGALSNTPVPNQDVAQVSANWPAGAIPARMANYLLEAQQKWAISAAPNGGGYPGSPYFKITIAGTDRTLAATENGELTVLPAYTGAPEQMWRIDQLADGSYRIMPKAVPNSKDAMALTAIGASSATLEKFDPSSDKQHWLVRLP